MATQFKKNKSSAILYRKLRHRVVIHKSCMECQLTCKYANMKQILYTIKLYPKRLEYLSFCHQREFQHIKSFPANANFTQILKFIRHCNSHFIRTVSHPSLSHSSGIVWSSKASNICTTALLVVENAFAIYFFSSSFLLLASSHFTFYYLVFTRFKRVLTWTHPVRCSVLQLYFGECTIFAPRILEIFLMQINV